jgi:peptidoglycan hydrolase FlgJ
MTDWTTASLYTDFQGLARLRKAAQAQSPDAIKETARQFEGMFIQMMLKAMRETLPRDGMLDSQQVNFYQEMYDKQISLELARNKGIGLAEALYRQLGGEGQAQTTPKKLNLPYAFSRTSLSTRAMAQPPDPVVPTTVHREVEQCAEARVQVPEQFIKSLWAYASKAAQTLGVDPEVLIAQSALETGWGKKILTDNRGQSSHNLFGIKADVNWRGARVKTSTLEYENGIAVRNRAEFRAYDSFEASFEDYVEFLRGNPRYRAALMQAHDPSAYLEALQKAGYATDPHYADKIRSIMSRGAYTEVVGQLKQSRPPPIS